MSITLRNIYAPAPQTKRGSPIFVGVDPKSGNIVYPCASEIVIRNLANPLQADIYYEHSCQTTVAKYAPSGYYIASGDVQGNVRIWDTTQKEHPLKLELRVLSGAVSDIVWSPDNQRIAVVGDGKEKYGAVFMWDAGSSVGEVSGHTKPLVSCDLRPTRPFRLATCGEDLSVGWFEGPPFRFKKSMRDNSRMMTCLRFSPDGEKFATASTDKKLVVYDGKTGEKLYEVEAHMGGIYGIAWSPDSKLILTASADKTAALIDAATGARVAEIALGNATEHQQLSALWHGETLVSVNLDGDLTYLRPDLGGVLRVLRGHNKPVSSLRAAEGRLFSSSTEGRIVRWDLATGESSSPAGAGHTNSVVALAVMGDTLVSASLDHTVRFTPLGAWEHGASVPVERDCMYLAVGVRTGAVVVATDSTVVLIRGGRTVAEVPVKFEPTTVAMRPDEAEVAVGSKGDNCVHLFAIKGDSLVETGVVGATVFRGALTSLAYSPCGKRLATADTSRNIFVWENGKSLVSGWVFHTARVNCITWHPNGENIASGGLDSSVYIWSLPRPDKRAFVKVANLGGVNTVTWVDERTLASAGADCAVKTWEVALP